jgi:hypothetical protein
VAVWPGGSCASGALPLLELEDGTDVPTAGVWATVVDAIAINVASINVDISERTPQEAAERM